MQDALSECHVSSSESSSTDTDRERERRKRKITFSELCWCPDYRRVAGEWSLRSSDHRRASSESPQLAGECGSSRCASAFAAPRETPWLCSCNRGSARSSTRSCNRWSSMKSPWRRFPRTSWCSRRSLISSRRSSCGSSSEPFERPRENSQNLRRSLRVDSDDGKNRTKIIKSSKSEQFF